MSSLPTRSKNFIFRLGGLFLFSSCLLLSFNSIALATYRTPTQQIQQTEIYPTIELPKTVELDLITADHRPKILSSDAELVLTYVTNNGTETVYRVEGKTNSWLIISEEGKVTMNIEDRVLFLNINDKQRGLDFFKQKLLENKRVMIDPRLKSFEINKSFFNEIKWEAVPEELRKSYLKRPFIVDVTKAADQYGIPPNKFSGLDNAIVQGSGKDITPEAYQYVSKTEPLVEDIALKIKNPGLLERFFGLIREKFPKAVSLSEKYLAGAGAVLAKLGPLAAGAGIIFGLIEMTGSISALIDLFKKEGFFGMIGSKEGQVEILNALSGLFGAISGGAFFLAIPAGSSIIGLPVAGAALTVSGVTGAISLAFGAASYARENWDQVVATVQHAYQTVVNGAQTALRWVADSATGVWDLVKNVAQSALSTAKDLIVGAASAVVDITGQAVNAVGNAVSATGNYVAEKAGDAVNAVGGLLAGAWNAITGAQPQAPRLVEKEIEVTRQVIDTVKVIKERFVPIVTEVVKYVPKTIYETVSRVVDTFVPIVRTVTDYVTQKVQEAYTYQVQKTKQITETVIKTVQQAYEVVKQVPRQIIEFISQPVTETFKIARTVYDTVTHWITERVAQVVPVVRTVPQTSYKTITEYIPQSVRSWLGWAWGWVTKYVPVVRTIAQTVYKTVTEYVTQWVDKTRAVTQQVPRTVYDTVTRVVNKILPVTRTIYDTVKETAYRFVQQPVQVVKNIIETVWETGTRIVEKIVPVVRQVTEYVHQAVATTERVAKTVYETVIERIPGMKKETYEEIVEVPRAVIEKVKVMVPES